MVCGVYRYCMLCTCGMYDTYVFVCYVTSCLWCTVYECMGACSMCTGLFGVCCMCVFQMCGVHVYK